MKFRLGKNSYVKANRINIHNSVVIKDNVSITCDEISLGRNSVISGGSKINCKKFIAGDYLYMQSDVEVGRGGSRGPNSIVDIGNNVGIFERTIINPSEKITIGHNVGIGGEVMIWTHGAWLDVTKGFPSDFGPVEIGDNVWIPARCIILPNVNIGDNVVIGINSIINKSLPSGCLAAGSPCRIIKEDYYPSELPNTKLEELSNLIINDWKKLFPDKNIKNVDVKYNASQNKILLEVGKDIVKKTQYDVIKKTIEGDENTISEDLRDYLRRRGIKIYTKKPFRSIKPGWAL